LLTLNSAPTSAQYTVVDANGTFIGNVAGVMPDVSDHPATALVTTQDANGIWIVMKVMQDGFVLSTPSENNTVLYTDPACATTPYLQVGLNAAPTTFTPLFRKLLSGSHGQLDTRGYYPGNPLVMVTAHSYSTLNDLSTCGPTTGNVLVGPLTSLDLTQFVPPFAVQ
jgi:hypothetical protein